jgi:hypothetical protein
MAANVEARIDSEAEPICHEKCRRLDGDMMFALPQMAGHVVILHSDECQVSKKKGESNGNLQ